MIGSSPQLSSGSVFAGSRKTIEEKEGFVVEVRNQGACLCPIKGRRNFRGRLKGIGDESIHLKLTRRVVYSPK